MYFLELYSIHPSLPREPTKWSESTRNIIEGVNDDQ